jgi:hypothetical protein
LGGRRVAAEVLGVVDEDEDEEFPF